MQNYEIIVEENVLKNTLYYRDTAVLTYTIRYPRFVSNVFQTFLEKLNIYYRVRALIYEQGHVQRLYAMAKEQFDYAMENDYPFHPYEVVTEYVITYNQNCFLSLYTDSYEYTGGAHGMTTRMSETWDLRKEQRTQLNEFFTVVNSKEMIIQQILHQTQREVQNGTFPYFEDYNSLVVENFNPENFYLSLEGIALYYGLYEIAPYASGIRTFLIPYTNESVIPPHC